MNTIEIGLKNFGIYGYLPAVVISNLFKTLHLMRFFVMSFLQFVSLANNVIYRSLNNNKAFILDFQTSLLFFYIKLINNSFTSNHQKKTKFCCCFLHFLISLLPKVSRAKLNGNLFQISHSNFLLAFIHSFCLFILALINEMNSFFLFFSSI